MGHGKLGSTIFCLTSTDHAMCRLEQLGELVPDLARWLLDTGLEEWSRAHGADSLGEDARKSMIESVALTAPSNAQGGTCGSVSSLDFMFVQ